MRAGSLSTWTVRGAPQPVGGVEAGDVGQAAPLKHPRVDLPLIAAQFEALRQVRRIGQGGAIVSVTQARQHDLSRRLLIGQAFIGQQAETEQPCRRRREQEAQSQKGLNTAGDEPPPPEPAYSAYQEQQAHKPANTNDAIEQHAGTHSPRPAARSDDANDSATDRKSVV